MKTILITGATGFLGKHLVGQLKEKDKLARLRIFCRGLSQWSNNSEIEVVRANIISLPDVLRAAEGVQEIYHLAGMVSRKPKDNGILYQTHIEGTRNVCEAARKHNIKKMVVVSSSGTVAVSPNPILHSETSGYKHEVVGKWPYYLSKIFAEKLTLSYWKRFQIPVVLVNPSLLLGPGDDRNSSTRDVALFLKGKILAIPRGGLNFVDVRDVAAGLITAMQSGSCGERYILAGSNWTFQKLIRAVSEISGLRAPKLQPSLGFSLVTARWLRRLYPLVGKSFELDEESIRMSALFWYCNSHKAQTELGFKSRHPMETLRDTVVDLQQRLGKN